MSRGVFITFEGTEGAGKSTLIRQLTRDLKKITRSKTLITREPGGPKVAEKIREILLKEHMDPWTEIFLYEAARAEHLAQKISPALKKGIIVLCDRYADSTLAYQGHARGLPWKTVHTLNHIATQGLKPHLTVFLDIPPAQGLKRATEKNRFERAGAKFQSKVRQGFLRAAKEDPNRWLILKVRGKTPERLSAEIQTVLTRRFSKIFSSKSRTK